MRKQPLLVLLTLALAAVPAHAEERATFPVRAFGAIPDDATDDTPAIREAIEAAGENGGIVLFEAGTYLCAPQRLDESAVIIIDRSDITLQGAGQDKTTLSCHVHGMREPDEAFVEKRGRRLRLQSTATWENDWEFAHRGHGILFRPPRGLFAGRTLRNVALRDLRLTGNAEPVDNDAWYSKRDKVFHWDTSHKGISLGWGKVGFDNFVLENVTVDHFRGELLYKGGDAPCNARITGCRFHSTPSSAVSGPSGVIEHCAFFDYYNAAVETYLTAGQTLVLRGNLVEANRNHPAWQPKNGFSIHNQPGAREGAVVIENNTVRGPRRWHLFSFGLSGATITGNRFEGLNGEALALRLFGHKPWGLRGHGENIVITDNTFVWEGDAGTPAIHLHAGGADVDATFRGNTLEGSPSFFLGYDHVDEKDSLVWEDNTGTGKRGDIGRFWK